MQAYKLTTEQKDLIVGELFAPDSYFNAVQDVNNEWFTSIEEVENCTNKDFIWIKELPLVEFVPKTYNLKF